LEFYLGTQKYILPINEKVFNPAAKCFFAFSSESREEKDEASRNHFICLLRQWSNCSDVPR
jgi:hypothetical protein